MKSILYLTVLSVYLLLPGRAWAQGNTEYGDGIKINLNEKGNKYIRFLTWGQFRAHFHEAGAGTEGRAVNVEVRRIRLLTYTQLNDRFFILFHVGVNGLAPDNASPVAKGESSQVALHDAYVEYRYFKTHYVGAGLHYWNGISRINGAGTVNFLTMDNNPQSWATFGLSDQYARHLGLFFKGSFSRLHYQVSVNEAITNSADVGKVSINNRALYTGRKVLGASNAGFTYAGYFSYQLFEEESTLLPFKPGTYLGSKKVLNVGGGFFAHPNGSVIQREGRNVGENVYILAADAFADIPLKGKNDAITAYLVYQYSNYGTNYLQLGNISPSARYGINYPSHATGHMMYAHVGYLIPGEKDGVVRFQPYALLNVRSVDATGNSASRFGVGGNILFTGHHSKLTLEYSRDQYGNNPSLNVFNIQAMVYL